MIRCSFPTLACIIIGLFLFGSVQRTFGQQKNTLKDSIQFFIAKGQGHKAFPYAKQWSEKVKVEVGEESEEYAGSLDTLGLCYFVTTQVLSCGKNGLENPLTKMVILSKKSMI